MAKILLIQAVSEKICLCLLCVVLATIHLALLSMESNTGVGWQCSS